jgi:hypothetical protein
MEHEAEKLGGQRDQGDRELDVGENCEAEVVDDPAPPAVHGPHEQPCHQGQEEGEHRLELSGPRRVKEDELESGELDEPREETCPGAPEAAPHPLREEHARHGEQRRENTSGPEAAAEERDQTGARPILEWGVHDGVVDTMLGAELEPQPIAGRDHSLGDAVIHRLVAVHQAVAAKPVEDERDRKRHQEQRPRVLLGGPSLQGSGGQAAFLPRSFAPTLR